MLHAVASSKYAEISLIRSILLQLRDNHNKAAKNRTLMCNSKV